MSKNFADQAIEEKVLFETFLNLVPDLSGETIVAWDMVKDGLDPPDVICKTATGTSVGVEICQWAHTGAMKDGRLTDRVSSNVLAAIGPQPIRESENFWLVGFHAKAKAHLLPSEYAAFRSAFFELINYIDHCWPSLKHRRRPYPFSDFRKFKPLDKYLERVTFCPADDALSAAVEEAVKAVGSVAVVSEANDAACNWIVPAGRAQWVRTAYDHCRWEPDDNGNITMGGAVAQAA